MHAGSGCELKLPLLISHPPAPFTHLQHGEDNPFSASHEAVHVKAAGNLQTIQITVMAAMIVLHREGYKEHHCLEPHSTPLGWLSSFSLGGGAGRGGDLSRFGGY